MSESVDSNTMRNVCHTDHKLSGWVGGGPCREFKRDVDKVRKHTESENCTREKVRQFCNTYIQREFHS